MKAARPGAKVDKASLEKKPIMQSAFSDMRKAGTSTSSENGSFGRKYMGWMPLNDRKLVSLPECIAIWYYCRSSIVHLAKSINHRLQTKQKS